MCYKYISHIAISAYLSDVGRTVILKLGFSSVNHVLLDLIYPLVQRTD